MPLYFAYGSNLSEDQMRNRCRDLKLISTGYLEGFRLGFTRYSSGWNGGVADILIEPGSKVWGLIYELSSMEELDAYEGYQSVYKRFKLTVQTPDGPVSNVWVYSVIDKKEFVHPSTQYLKFLIDAAQKFGFPAEYKKLLESYYRARDEAEKTENPYS